MATRSTIALEFADGTVGQVYCHWDGYLEHNGKILLENYQDPFKVRELIDMGDVSSLGPNIGAKHPFSPHGSAFDQVAYDAAMEAGATTFYGRDRGEDGVSARYFKDFDSYQRGAQFEEYNYILRQVDGRAVWFVCYNDKFVELEDELKETAE